MLQRVAREGGVRGADRGQVSETNGGRGRPVASFALRGGKGKVVEVVEKEVILYTQPGCPCCAREKRFLEAKGVAFVEKDVTRDREALRELEEMGSKSTPTTVIDGRVDEAIVGCDKERLTRSLGLRRLRKDERMVDTYVGGRETAEGILGFWFGEGEHTDRFGPRPEWFSKAPDPAFDAAVRDRFLEDHELAASGGLGDWSEDPRGCLALLLLLDQFPRNMFRGTARAYATDADALRLAGRAVSARMDEQLPPIWRWFVYMPFMHAEDAAHQGESVRLFLDLAEEHPEAASILPCALRHAEIVERFGRFPHRNGVLGRETTAEEAAFLRLPGSSF